MTEQLRLVEPSAHEGYQREVACQQIAATVEAVLRMDSGCELTPLATVLLPTPVPVSVPVPVVRKKKRWWSR
jgi:hypothetical protein